MFSTPAAAQGSTLPLFTIYVVNVFSDTVSVIDGATNTVTTTITVGDGPFAIAVMA